MNGSQGSFAIWGWQGPCEFEIISKQNFKITYQLQVVLQGGQWHL
jgi:hypothetical protein